MKRGIFLAILFVILASNVCAITTDIGETYSGKETVVLEIKGAILEPIKPNQVELTRGHVSVPIEYDVKKIGEKYYVWFIAPENENNYTLNLKDIVANDGGAVKEVDYSANFSVSGLIDYNVKPGAIITKNSFSIEVNLFEDVEKIVSSNFPEERNIILNPGVNNVNFIAENKSGVFMITFGKYIIPAQIETETIGDVNKSEVLPEFRFNPRFIESSVLNKGEIIYPVEIVNSGGKELNITLEFNDSLFDLSAENTEVLKGERFHFNITVLKKEKNIESQIIASSGSLKVILPIKINFTNDSTDVSTPYLEENFTEESLYRCSELGGQVCSADTVCDSDPQNSLDGECCIGQCIKEEEERSYSWIGYILGLIVVLGGIWLFVKYRKTSSSEKEAFEKRFKSAEERLSS